MADRHDVQLRTKLLEKIFPSVDTVDNLESDNPNRPLSARQGKVLKELINAGGGGGSGLSIEVVESLPATGVKGILYLVPKTSYLKEENTYDEYVWIESSQKYELLGSFSTDLNIEEYVDKFNSILGEVGEINVATLSDYGINSYVTTGTYRVYGERINSNDGLPILNAANGHTVEGILKVYNSSISGSGKDTDKVVTQMLSMSNRHGGDGHVWIRTGQGASEDNLTWSTWEKLQGIFEKNTIQNVSELDTFTTNGIYSCMYVGGSGDIGNYPLYPGDTLLIVVVNGYMASSIGTIPQLTQTILKTGSGGIQNQIITRSAIWTGSAWNFNGNNNIVLGSFCGNQANIGGVADAPSAHINIGTYLSGYVDIADNVFIGEPRSNYDNRQNGATIIYDNVRIGRSVAIGTASNNEETIIEGGSQLFLNDDGFNIKQLGNNTCLLLRNNASIGINSASVSLGNGEGSIWIGNDIYIGTAPVNKSNVYIGNQVSINEKTNIGKNVSIGKTLDSTKTVSIGTGVYIDSDTNIGLNVSIGKTFDLSKSVSIGRTVHIDSDVNIGNHVEIGKNVKILDSVSIGTLDKSRSISIDGGVHIKGPVDITGAFTSASDVTLGNTINIGDRLTIGNDVNISNNVAIGDKVSIGLTEQSVSDLVIIGTDVKIGGIVHIDGGFIVEKNIPAIGKIVFNENNIVFQVGDKFTTFQLSTI